MAFSIFLFSEPVEKQTHFGIFKCKMAVGHDCSALNPKFESLRGNSNLTSFYLNNSIIPDNKSIIFT